MSAERILMGQYTGKSKSGGNYRHVRIDGSTETLQMIEYEHHEIHSGSHFFVHGVVDLSINEVYDIRITTQNTSKEAHFLYHILTDSKTDIYMYEGVQIAAAGTNIPIYNNNRNLPTNSILLFSGILNTSTALANEDTLLAGSTAITHRKSGDGKEGGVVDRSDELILKRGTVYCKRFIATAAGYINWKFQWYEHTPKNAG